MPETPAAPQQAVIAATRDWVERAVIGLNLCPFAKSVHAAGLIRYAVSDAQTALALADRLADELAALAEADPARCETTLLIHPAVLTDFLDYNDFLGEADALIEEMGYAGVLQVASFHPQYQFADTAPDAIENCTNRSPYPTLHLLREDSIARAVTSVPDTDAIYTRNVQTLRALGHAGWRRLFEPAEK